jgi:Tol biopolymer transport system component
VWTEESESYPSFAPDGTMQFSSRRPGGFGEGDLWRAPALSDGEFGPPVNLGRPVNSEHRESDSCVAPDGSYIVLTSGRPGGHGNGDLYVSFRDPSSGAWSEPVNLGGQINTADTDYCPMITPDGRYLFFSRRVSDPIDSGWEGVIAGDVYWVDANVIERLRE